MFDFNAALKEIEERQDAEKAQAAANDQAKNKAIKTLRENVEIFLRSRGFGGSVYVQGYKLFISSSFAGTVSVTAENGGVFAVAPEVADRPGTRPASIAHSVSISEQEVTKILVGWIVAGV